MGHENGGWMNADQREAMEDNAAEKQRENAAAPFPELHFVARVKLPNSATYHCSPSGDADYAEARRNAIFAAKPAGFEVRWPRAGERWPVDSEGYTFVPLVLTDRTNAAAVAVEENVRLRRNIAKLKVQIDGLMHLLD